MLKNSLAEAVLSFCKIENKEQKMQRFLKIMLGLILVLIVLIGLPVQTNQTQTKSYLNFKSLNLFSQGVEHFKNQNYQQALLDFTEVINHKGNLVSSAYSNRCLIYIQLGNNQAAKSDCTASLQINSKNLETALNLGLAEYRLGNYHKAIKQYQKIIQRNKNDYRAYYNQGLAHFALANYKQALKNYKQALFSPNLSSTVVKALVYTEKGLGNFMLGDLSKALADFNSAISLDKSNEKAYYNRGCVYHKAKNYTAALKDFTLALQLNPQYAEAYLNRGWVHHELGLEQAAITDLNQALEQFKEQGNTKGSLQVLDLIKYLHQILAGSNRVV